MTARTTGSFSHDGETIYYESTGTGDPVVLCHGLGGNHACWWQVLPTLARRHRVITWDQRGFGNSTRRTGRYGPEPAVGDLLALVDELGLERAQVLGQSMGGWVAMGFALAHPERVRSLILTDTLAGVLTAEVSAELQRATATPPASFRTEDIGEHPALGESFRHRRPELAYLYQQISSMGDKPDDAEVFRMLWAMKAPVDRVRTLDIPVLLVVGEHDDLCPPSVMRLIAAEIPGSRLDVIEDAGHSPYFERPEEWAEAVGRFLRAQAPA